MGFRVKPDGSIEVDSVEEAVALSRRLAQQAESVPAITAATTTRPAAAATAAPERKKVMGTAAEPRATQQALSGVEMFLATLPPDQRQFLDALKDMGQVCKTELPTLLNIEGTDAEHRINGIIAAVVRAANKHHIDRNALFGTTRIRGVPYYSPGPVLHTIAAKEKLAVGDASALEKLLS